MANLFNSYFSNNFIILAASKYVIEIDYSHDPICDTIKKAIFDLFIRTNANKAAGPDKIDSKLIKFCTKGLARPL